MLAVRPYGSDGAEADAMICLAITASFLLGIAAGSAPRRALSKYRIRERETARLDFLMALGGAVDLEPCEFTHTWQEPRS
jgi:hypothetical protein